MSCTSTTSIWIKNRERRRSPRRLGSKLRDERLLADDGRVFATHIAHDTNPTHPELVAFASQHGYEVAYDGLVVDTTSSWKEAGSVV